MAPRDFFHWPLHLTATTWDRQVLAGCTPLPKHRKAILDAAYQRTVLLSVRDHLGRDGRKLDVLMARMGKAGIRKRRPQRILTGEVRIFPGEVGLLIRHFGIPVPDPAILTAEIDTVEDILASLGFKSPPGGTPGQILGLVTTGKQDVDGTSASQGSWFDRAAPLLDEACRTIMAETVGGTHDHDDASHVLKRSGELPAHGWGLFDDGFCSLCVAVPDRWVRDVLDAGFALLDDRFVLEITHVEENDALRRPVRVRALRGLPGSSGSDHPNGTWLFGVADAQVRWDQHGPTVTWVYDDPEVAFDVYDSWVEAQEARASP